MQLTKPYRYLLSLLSGILLTLSFPYTGSMIFLGFVAWVPLLILEEYIDSKRYRSTKVFVHALLTFAVYNIGTTWWVYYASAEGAYMAFIANTLLMTLVFYFFHVTKRTIGKKEGYFALVIYWIAFEYFHYNWESSWPWLSLGNIFSIQPEWVQWYSFTGVLGGSIWLLLVNILVLKIFVNIYFKRENWRIQAPLIYGSVLLVLLPIGFSIISYLRYDEKQNPIRVMAVQPNIDPYNEKFVSDVFTQLDKLFKLAESNQKGKIDLIVAPETAISLTFDELRFKDINLLPYLIHHQKKMGNPDILIGASTHRVFDKKNSHASRYIKREGIYIEHYNTSILFNQQQEAAFIHKSKLVPGVEKIPFASTFPFLEDFSIDLGGTSGSLGIEKEAQIFHASKAKIAPVICYESIFGGFLSEQCRKGAQLICIITNDGWWRDTPGYKQHLSFARLRAIENRRSVVRSANTGTTAFINQRGDTFQETEWWKEAVIQGEVNLNHEQTFYTKYGDVTGRSFGFIALLLFAYTIASKFRPTKPLKDKNQS